MNCSKCGKYIPVDYTFCPNCRQKVPERDGGPVEEATVVEAEVVVEEHIPDPEPAAPKAAPKPMPEPEPESVDSKRCPYCAETIRLEAIICRFCRMNLKTGLPVVANNRAQLDVVEVLKWGCGLIFGLPLAMFLILVVLARGC